MKKTTKDLTAEEMLKMEPVELIEYINSKFKVDVPINIESQQEINNASKRMAVAASYYSFFQSLKSQANVLKRYLKRTKADKILIEDMIDRENIFDTQASIMKQTYDTISRLFTIKHRELDELKMLNLK